MVSCRDMPGPQIPHFYAGRSIFITGATGFMGKVLVERLLWTCPDVDQLFLLVRTKKDQDPEKRLLQLKESQVFDNVRAHCPGQLDKLRAVAGDIELPGLGMTPESVALLKTVSVVFHSAATLKFHETLTRAVQQNVRSVLSVLHLCDNLPNMQALVYVSTAYSNSDLSVVEERVYPPPGAASLEGLLALTDVVAEDTLAEITDRGAGALVYVSTAYSNSDLSVVEERVYPPPGAASLEGLLALTDVVAEDTLAEITDRYISPKPNTYTFTKAMAEVAVQNHGCGNYPIAIFRPSIVISAYRNPFPGWVENLNGPTGVVVGAGKGLLHVFRCRSAARADMLPVDIAIDTLLATAWEIATDRLSEIRVYNCTTYNNPTTWGAFEQSLRAQVRKHPLEKVMWYPYGVGVENGFVQKVLETFLQTIPLHLAEYFTRIFGIKTRLSLIMVSNRLAAMNEVLKFFSQREWHFVTENVDNLRRRLSPEDAAIYNLDPKSFTWDDVYENFIKGTKKYVLKEKEENMGEAKRHLRRMFYLHNGVLLLSLAAVVRLSLGNKIVSDLVHGAVRVLLTVFDSVSSRIMAFKYK